MKTFLSPTAALLSIALAPSAFAHAVLQSSLPKSGEILHGSPTTVVLNFNEALEAPFSKITLIHLPNDTIKTAKATVDSKHSKILQLTTPILSVGSYQVQWSAMTQDGHRAKGQYGFQVK